MDICGLITKIGYIEAMPDALMEGLSPIVAGLKIKAENQDFSCLRKLYSRKDIFGVDLYEIGMGKRIGVMAAELYSGTGTVRRRLHW